MMARRFLSTIRHAYVAEPCLGGEFRTCETRVDEPLPVVDNVPTVAVVPEPDGWSRCGSVGIPAYAADRVGE